MKKKNKRTREKEREREREMTHVATPDLPEDYSRRDTHGQPEP